jgi:hypothetical protein
MSVFVTRPYHRAILLGCAASIGGGVPISSHLEYASEFLRERCEQICAETPIERHHGGHLHLEPFSHSLSSTATTFSMIDLGKVFVARSF